MTSHDRIWRTTVLTLFPGDVSGAARRQPGRQGAGVGLWALEARDIRASATDAIAASTIPRPAADPAWCCAPICWRPRSMPRTSRAETLPTPADEPAGSAIDPVRVQALAAGPGALIVCGRFEGIDQRVIEARGLEEVSIGDYVLSGGEIAAMALIDACVRLLPGVMGKAGSGTEESFSEWTTRIPSIYPAPDLRGPLDPGNPDFRRPRQGRGLAPGRSRGLDPGPADRTSGPSAAKSRQKTRRKGDKGPALCRIAAPNPQLMAG